MGYLNLDIKEGVFDDIEASGILDGIQDEYVPSWQDDPEVEKFLDEHYFASEWQYE